MENIKQLSATTGQPQILGVAIRQSEFEIRHF
jgi:hypothetical protein